MYYTDTQKFNKFNFFGFLEKERYEKTTTNLMIKKQHQIYTSSSEKNDNINEKY